MAQEFAAAIDVIRLLGAQRALAELPRWLVHREFVFYAITLHLGAAAAPDPTSFRLDLGAESDVADLVAARPQVYTAARVRERFRRGDLAFVGRIGHFIVHLRWISTGLADLPYLHRRLVLPPGVGFLDEVYTVPAWRRKGVESTAAAAMLRRLPALGVRQVLCAIAKWNLAPQRVAEAHGYERVGAGSYWNLLGPRGFSWRGAIRARGRGEIIFSVQEKQQGVRW